MIAFTSMVFRVSSREHLSMMLRRPQLIVPYVNCWLPIQWATSVRFSTKVAPRLFGPTVRWLLGRQMTMNMLGVPREQGLEVKASYSNGIAGFIQSCLEAVCCHLPFQ